MYQVEDQIKLTLRLIGANRYETSLPEVSMLPELLDANEQILGVVFGRYKHFLEGLSGHGALIATNQRILLIDRKNQRNNTMNILICGVVGVDTDCGRAAH